MQSIVSEKARIREMDAVELEEYKHELMRQPMFIGKNRLFRFILKNISQLTGTPMKNNFLREYNGLHNYYHPSLFNTKTTNNEKII